MIGRQVSHFYIIRSLGRGGMGMVYEAQDARLPRSVAIKFLTPQLSRDIEAVRRFKREARLASSLNHPNICTILEVDEGIDQSFIVMELLQGQSLRERLEKRPLTISEILDIAIQVADALGAAHDQGIVHRDITPGNIFVTASGLVKILDFGLAKQFASFEGDGPTDELTEPGAIAGTVHYMAPERFVPGAAADHRCDLFSFGAVLYQMATGAKPFEGRTKAEVIALIREQPHTPVRQLAPHQSRRLARIIDTLLAKPPERRYQSAWALRTDLDSLRKQITPIPAAPAADGEAASVAVLPFEVVGIPGMHSEHFRLGLAADIGCRLGGVPDVRVAPRTSVLQVTQDETRRSIRDLGRLLNVQMIIEGTVQEIQDRVRVTANVIGAASEQAMQPAIRVERRCADVLDVQDEIAREIVSAASPSLVKSPAKRFTQDAEAYHAFKRGQYHWKDCFAGGWRPALDQFEYAVQRDSRFCLAHVALAAVYNFLGFYGYLQPRHAFNVAREASERALDIDHTLAAAHAERALSRFGGDWDWDGAEQDFRAALSFDSDNPLAHIYYAWLLILLGRDDAALAEAAAGHALAPSSRLVVAGRAQTLYLARRYDEAIEWCDECLRGDPGYAFATHLRAQCYQMKRVYARAIDDFERVAGLSNRAPFYLGLLGHCYGECGMKEKALALLGELNRVDAVYVPPQCFVYIYAGLGERDEALSYQERAYADGASPFNYLTPNIRDLYALDATQKTRLEQMRLVV